MLNVEAGNCDSPVLHPEGVATSQLALNLFHAANLPF